MSKHLVFFIGAIILGLFYSGFRHYLGFEITIIVMFATFMAYVFSRDKNND